MVTKQHHKAIAEIIEQESNKAYQWTHTANLVNKLADYFAKDNEKFDREKFLKACGL